jgi:hypothetical protein
MSISWMPRRILYLTVAVVAFAFAGAAELNPEALVYKLPSQIVWRDTPASATAILAGDPSKPGLYVELIRWHPGHGSRPHSHPNDRYIYVISGTWYVGTGPNYDPDHMVAMPAGTSITHFGKQIHYDGAKDQEALIELVGEGPATTTSAEAKK